MSQVRTHRSKSVVAAARLHRARHRRERGQTLVEGPQVIADVIAAGADIIEIFGIAPVPELGEVVLVDERALARLAGTKSPRGPVAVVEIPLDRIETGQNLLVAAGLSEPGNVGTLIRTAAAFGWGFAFMPGSADPWAPKTIRAGAGAQFQTPISALEDIGGLDPFTRVALVVRDGDPPWEIDDAPVALLVGEEAHGLDPQVIEAAERTMTIPMTGPTESLNAAVAGSIAIYALSNTGGRSTRGV